MFCYATVTETELSIVSVCFRQDGLERQTLIIMPLTFNVTVTLTFEPITLKN